MLTFEIATGNMDASKLKISGAPGKTVSGSKKRQRQMTVMVQVGKGCARAGDKSLMQVADCRDTMGLAVFWSMRVCMTLNFVV